MDTGMKDKRITTRDSSAMMVIKNYKTTPILTTSKNHSSLYAEEQQDQDFMISNAFSWPPRSYTCSFCKREFRSAQALGGHMNVHRKDRARLRQSPPSDLLHGRYGNTILNLNQIPNPNPNPNPNLSSNNASLLLSSPNYGDVTNKRWSTHANRGVEFDHHVLRPSTRDNKKRSVCGMREEQLLLHDHGFSGKSKISETTTSVRLELEIGLLRGHDSDFISGRDLDLELRLGYSN